MLFMSLHQNIDPQLSYLYSFVGQAGFFGGTYASFMATGDDMTEDDFHRGLVENIKANIHSVSYENTLVYTPDKKLVYHVFVSKPAKEQKKYTIYQDIGNVWNYRTVGIRKSAFQGNKTLEEIDFAESPYIGRTNYVPMQMAIPDSAFAGCSNLKRFSLIYRTQLRSESRDVHGNYAKYDSLTISGPLGNLDLAVIRYLAGCDAYSAVGRATDGRLRYLNLYNATIKETGDGYNYFNDDLSLSGERYHIEADNHLPDYLFYKCTALETVILPKSLKEIGARIFARCSGLKQVAVTGSIDRYAFYYCVSLDTIYISTDSVPELAQHAFETLPYDFRILVPKKLCKLYREKWAQYASHINVNEGFYHKNLIQTVTVTAPNTLAKVLGLNPDISKSGDIYFNHLHGLRGDYSGITHLKVVGPISATDFDLLKHLAGFCAWTETRNYTGHLEYLDLYDAQIVEDDNYAIVGYGTVAGGSRGEDVEADELPTYAFQNAYNLKTLILPRTCKKVRTRAMIGCEDLETLVIGDDMEDFNWNALDDGASLTRMYILAKKKPDIGAEFAVWRWLCNNYNPTFDAFYVRPSLYNDYIADANYTGSSWQRTNNISKGDFDDDESFCAFAAHAAATKDDLAMVTSVDGWFDKHPSVKDLSLLGYTAIDSLNKATLAPLTELQQIALSVTLTGMEEGLFASARHLRSVDFLLCDSTDIVAGLRDGGLAKLGINTQQTLAYVPSTYGPTSR